MKRIRIVLIGMVLLMSQVFSDVYDVIRAGEALSADDVTKIEASLVESPENVTERTKLLGYYFKKQFSEPSCMEAHSTQVLWLIEHAPEADVLGLPYGSLNKHMAGTAYLKGKELWISQIASTTNNVAVLDHAAQYFTQSDHELAAQLRNRQIEEEPENYKWRKDLGNLYLLEMQGAAGQEEKDWARKAQVQFKTAQEQAESMLNIPGFGWNSGNNMHYGNIIQGHVALVEGDIPAASELLIIAGQTKGSPQLNSFGPNFTLAKDLYAAGEKDAVLTYLDECSSFWTMDRGRLKQWTDAINDNQRTAFNTRVKF